MRRLGIDVGSTTAKTVVLDAAGDILFSAYRRHNAQTLLTLQGILRDALRSLGDVDLAVRVTGSAGMGIAERFDLPYIQEVISSAEVVRRWYPNAMTLIDIGGEDAKLVFFAPGEPPDIRMNGSCAGGTGAYIDEMANLLAVSPSQLSDLAERYRSIHPIASRCGVFGKTDVQNLLSREVPKPDVAASIFNAVVLQTLTTLARGRDVEPGILLCGGPLTFLPALRYAFQRVLDAPPTGYVETAHGQLLPALGAALVDDGDRRPFKLRELEDMLGRNPAGAIDGGTRLPPLFPDVRAYEEWLASRMTGRLARAEIGELGSADCFLGVDSGSTTTKLVLLDTKGRILFDYYRNNRGDAIGAVREGLEQLAARFAACGRAPSISRSVATGYGEDLVRAAFGFDDGIVETLAHYRAAYAFDPQVSFILDIGGQDMKAVFVEEGRIQNIVINDACSSGCGSFIENFANGLGYEVASFAEEACLSRAPCDLGTRCTVFMNSKVKQAQREGAEISDIAAGLAYSVIKNAIHKVLRISDFQLLGDNIVVQGGTFRNPAVHMAMESLLGRHVVCPEIPELMGAYGAALSARDASRADPAVQSRFVGFDDLAAVADYRETEFRCKGCENHCTVTKLAFPSGNAFFTGNRCERLISNAARRGRNGANLPRRKCELLFDRDTDRGATRGITVGFPRALDAYEHYPFWNELLLESGFRVRLSNDPDDDLQARAATTVASENICYPAKLAHAHVLGLLQAGVDRILFPMAFNARREFFDADNTYMCPIVAGYADVIRSTIDPEGTADVPLDMPSVTFEDSRLLMKSCWHYLSPLGVGPLTFLRAFRKAIAAQADYRRQVSEWGAFAAEQAHNAGRLLVVLAGRPYHVDPLINHRLPEMLSGRGIDVITEDAVPDPETAALGETTALTGWAYTNRVYRAARWVGQTPFTELVQLNSFACGLDAYALDEVRSILESYGKRHTVIRIDEIQSTGSAKLRLRSMIELAEQSQWRRWTTAAQQSHSAPASGRLPLAEHCG